MGNAIVRQIPNAITCCNLISGCMATGAAFYGNYQWAILMIIIGAVFDFFDGMSARLLHVSSPIGKELDSLADVVTFGVAPSAMIFYLFHEVVYPEFMQPLRGVMPYTAFLMAAFSALRLAKFNIDERQTTSFIGMPVPAHALLWGSLACTLQPYVAIHASTLLYGGILLAIVTSYLLVSELPMFSMKVKNLSWKGNELRYVLGGCGLVFVLLFKIPGVAATILLYILLSLFNRKG